MNERKRGVAGQSVRWPYVVALVSAVVAATGVLFAPISGIVYVLGLPGLLVASVWVLVHRGVSGRQTLPIATAIMLTGLLMGIAVLLIGRQMDPLKAMSNVWYEAGVIGAMLWLPLTSIVVAVIGASNGLGSRVTRRSGTHIVDLQS